MEQEIWKTAQYIFDSDGHTEVFPNYEVSSLGRVRSLKRNGKAKEKKQQVVYRDNTIWYELGLSKNGRVYTVKVHRLVLSTFKGDEYFPNAIVDHIIRRTESSCINTLDNLRWVTPSQNRDTDYCNEAIRKALTNDPKRSKRVKVTDLTTGEITEYPSAREAERAIGLPQYTISVRINQHDNCYKRLGLHFEYIK